MLKQLGCSSDHAEHGEQALEQLMFSEPGLHTLVLMDLRMNVMDGFNATMAIKKMGMDVPIIAVTADGRSGHSSCAQLSAVRITPHTHPAPTRAPAHPIAPTPTCAPCSQETRARCKEIGFDDFATKPLLAETMAALLEKHTGHKLVK